MGKYIVGIIITFFLFQIPNGINAQIRNDTTFFELLPFKKSYTIFQSSENRRRGLPSTGLNLFSGKDSVFSLAGGTVEKVILLDSICSVIIKSEKEMSIVYHNLSMTSLTKGHFVNKGDFIGKAFYNGFAKDHYLSIVMKKGKRNLTRREHIDLIYSLAQNKN